MPKEKYTKKIEKKVVLQNGLHVVKFILYLPNGDPVQFDHLIDAREAATKGLLLEPPE